VATVSSMTALVSVIIPAFEAEETIARAIYSLTAQTYPHWRAIVVADDRRDYGAVLAAAGIDDRRLRHATTGRIAAGPSIARNVGLALATGALIAPLDADDTYLPERLATLVPLALAHGAATDNVRVIDAASGRELTTAFDRGAGVLRLDASRFLATSVPLMPVVRAELAGRWDEDIEFAEDVLFNARLYDRVAWMPATQAPLRDYFVRVGSAAHGVESGGRAAAAYRRVLARLDDDGLGFRRASLRRRLFGAVKRKIVLNAAYERAYRAGACANFQAFIASDSARAVAVAN